MSERDVEERDWARVARDYGDLHMDDFDARYPGWSSDDAFMDQLRQEFDGGTGEPPPGGWQSWEVMDPAIPTREWLESTLAAYSQQAPPELGKPEEVT